MMNTSTIRTKKGKTIMLQFDVASPRPYSRIQLVSGTKGAALKYPEPARYSQGHEWLSPEEYKAIEAKYTPPIVKKIGEMAKQVGGHGGMDFLMDWRTIDCLRNGLPLDQDVYDAAYLEFYRAAERMVGIASLQFHGCSGFHPRSLENQCSDRYFNGKRRQYWRETVVMTAFFSSSIKSWRGGVKQSITLH
jgi:hypothetical protein